MYPILFRLGPLTIYSYGVMSALAFLVGILLALRQAKKEGISPEIILDLAFWILISGLIGARIVYVMVNFKGYLQNPLEIIMYQKGGLVFYGGFIAAVIVGILFLKRKHLEVWKIVDIVAPSVALGHSIGRIGCFLNGCCYGREASPPWGIKFPPESPAGMTGYPVIPTQLYSALSLLIIFFILRSKRRKKKFTGEIFWLYLVLYPLFRFFLEILRGDPRGHIFFLSTSQFLSIFIFIIGIMMFKKFSDAEKKKV